MLYCFRATTESTLGSCPFLVQASGRPPPLRGPLSGTVAATTDVCGSFPSKKTGKYDSY